MPVYVGAFPGGRPAPDLSTVPPLGFNLAFANDAGGGNFQPQWDPAITPEVIAQLKQQGDFYFSASLGGDANYAPWVPPSDPAAWVSNATSSLVQLMDTYGLSYLDIDYEGGPNGLDDSFVECISQVLINIGSPQSRGIATIAPFAGTLSAYQALWEQCSTWINTVNYQAYADGIPDVQGYLDLYAGLAQQFYGYDRLGLGIASSASSPRGLQPPDIYTVYEKLHAQGMGGVAIWCAEDSATSDPPFAIENTLLSIAQGG